MNTPTFEEYYDSEIVRIEKLKLTVIIKKYRMSAVDLLEKDNFFRSFYSVSGFELWIVQNCVKDWQDVFRLADESQSSILGK